LNIIACWYNLDMTARTHDLFALSGLSLVVGLGWVGEISLATGLCALMGAIVGGLAPDLDESSSAMWQRLPAGTGTILGRLIAPVFGSHRFVSHSLVGWWVFGWILNWLATWTSTFLLVDTRIVWWAAMIGFASHILADMLTKEGVPLLWPIPIKFGLPPIKAWRIKTGGWVEKLVVFPGLVIANGYWIYTKYGQFVDVVRNWK
jgi:inner membrane protein